MSNHRKTRREPMTAGEGIFYGSRYERHIDAMTNGIFQDQFDQGFNSYKQPATPTDQ